MMLAAAAVLILAAAGGWYWGSPWWTLWRMREAARAGDMGRLAAYVDGAAIRKEAEREFRGNLASVLTVVGTGTPNGRRFVDLARRRLADPAARAIMDFRPWLASIPIRFAGFGGGSGDSGYRPYIVHRGLDAFEVRQEGAGPENGPMLTFRRHGLGWKLAGVRWGQQ
jgi:hypothetical protein